MDILHHTFFPLETFACHGGCDFAHVLATRNNHKANADAAAQPIFKLGHITVHSFPRRHKFLRLLTLFLLFAAWAYFIPNPVKARVVLLSIIYSFVEFTFTTLSSPTPEGRYFTTLGQFLVNLLYLPFGLEAYMNYFAPSPTNPTHALVVLLFPLNIWLLELVEDRMLIFLYGRNVAWCYAHDYEDSHFGGVIRRGHGKYWVLMGLAALLIWPSLSEFTNKTF